MYCMKVVDVVIECSSSIAEFNINVLNLNSIVGLFISTLSWYILSQMRKDTTYNNKKVKSDFLQESKTPYKEVVIYTNHV
jgi:hypothetical protein